MKVNTKGNFDNDKQRKGVPCQFIAKLLEMMKQYPHNVKWSENGDQICFFDLKLIQNEVLPAYFRHRNTLSFIRQLNMYSFSKSETEEKNCLKFKHKTFQRGKQDSFHMIGRKNKVRDEIIENLEKNYNQTLKLLKQSKISQKAKSLLRVTIQYNSILLKNLKKIKTSISQIDTQLKATRNADMKASLSKLKEESLPRLLELIQSSKNIDNFVKQQLFRDPQRLISFNSGNNNNLFQQLNTYKNMVHISHLPPLHQSDCSMFAFKMNSFNSDKSQISFGNELKEERIEENDSLGQSLRDGESNNV